VQRHDPQAFAIGRSLATDPDPLRGSLRADALRALAHLADEPGVAPLLVAAARADVDSNVRITALRALRGRSDPPTAVQLSLLGEALWDQSYTVRAAAARELSRWPAELAAPLLSARAELEPDPTVLRALRAPRHAAPADD
jgi:HEAT repeat protein